ncbi:MAG: cyclase family protein [Anaerolineae bacterium]|jgi:arylformamidase
MQWKKVIDLSHPLRPGREARPLEIEELESTDVTGAQPEEEWYIMHHVSLVNHLGTHIEVPYHCLPDGADLAQIPAEQFVGEAVILDLRGHGANEGITLDTVKRAASEAGGIGEGDVAFCMTGWSQHYDAELYSQPPFLAQEALRWLVGRGIKMLGIDTRGSMNPANPDRLNHLPLFEAGVNYIENLTNLEAVPETRVAVAALPPAIEGLEGFPVRVVAFC